MGHPFDKQQLNKSEESEQLSLKQSEQSQLHHSEHQHQQQHEREHAHQQQQQLADATACSGVDDRKQKTASGNSGDPAYAGGGADPAGINKASTGSKSAVTSGDSAVTGSQPAGTGSEPAVAGGQPAGTGSETTASKHRPSCSYGPSCYRRNPSHFAEEAHPGDPDYRDPFAEEEEGEDGRPECEYGAECYRRNPEHRKNFKHTHTAEKPRRAKVRKKCSVFARWFF